MTPSVPTCRELRADLVLVALPPRERVERSSGLVVLPAGQLMVDRRGIVLQVGAAVTDVQPRDRVLFGADVGEEVIVDQWPCLLLRERDIDAVFEGANDE